MRIEDQVSAREENLEKGICKWHEVGVPEGGLTCRWEAWILSLGFISYLPP